MYIFGILIFTILFVLLMLQKKDKESIGEFNINATRKLKGWMILFVLVGHTCNFVLDKNVSCITANLSMWGNIAVCTFFFISGYGLMHSYDDKKEEYLKGFIKKRFSRILIPLILATIIFLPINYIVLQQTTSLIIYNYLAGIPALRFSWFCHSICVFYFAFWLIAKFAKNRSIIVLMVYFCIVYAVCLNLIGWKEHWYASSLSIPLGMFVSHNEIIIKDFIKNHRLLTGTLLLILYLMTIVSGIIGISYYAISICIPLLLYTVTILSSNISYFSVLMRPINHAMDYFGKISYELYLCHGAFITLSSIYVERFQYPAICIIILAVVLFPVTIVFKKICDKISIIFKDKF